MNTTLDFCTHLVPVSFIFLSVLSSSGYLSHFTEEHCIPPVSTQKNHWVFKTTCSTSRRSCNRTWQFLPHHWWTGTQRCTWGAATGSASWTSRPWRVYGHGYPTTGEKLGCLWWLKMTNTGRFRGIFILLCRKWFLQSLVSGFWSLCFTSSEGAD